MSSLSLSLIYFAKVLIFLGTATCTVKAGNDKQYQNLHHDIIITAVPVEIGYEVSLVVSGPSSRFDDRVRIPAPTTRGHLRSR